MLVIFIVVSTLIYFKLIFRLENKPGKTFYSCLFVGFSCLYTVLKDTYNNSFYWPSISEHAAAYKLLSPEILTKDFIVNGILISPKIIFLKILVFFPDIFGLNLSFLLEFIDAFAQIFSPAIFYFATAGIIYKIGSKSEETKSFVFYFVFVFLLYDYYFEFFTKNLSFSYFQTFSKIKHISYSTSFSFFLGLLFFSLYEKHKKKSIVLFILLTIINPLCGIIIFGIWSIYFYQFERQGKVFLLLTIIIFLTGFVIKVFYTSSEINTKDFVQIYIYERHNHHYLISKGINPSFFRLLFLFAFPLLFNVSRKLRRIFLLSFVFIFGIILNQFIFIEVFPTKLFSTLTLNRATVFTLFLLFINYFLFISFFIDKYQLIKYIKIKKQNKKVTILMRGLNRFYKPWIILIPAIILALTLSFKRKSKLPNSYIVDHKEVTSWISENTESNDVFQVCPTDIKLNFYFRIYHERSIFWGYEFPFHQGDFITWVNRKNKIEIAKRTGNFQRLKNQIDYVIIPNNRNTNEQNLIKLKRCAQFTIFKIK